MTAIFDIDGDGMVDPGADGVLISRYHLGLRGDDLVGGIDISGSPRSTASEVEGYLLRVWPQVDVDGDGFVTNADVNLVLRYMSGITGSILTSGCAVIGAIRRSAADVEEYLGQMVA